ncbi:hypothetical protein Poli38472_006896 [Pythium oligandrum]|uniref:Uncharacterized protein n=1 Tax=Pythium oligandrum TaxID=41045 RepID=A0A8K1C998_PYTOL|nr:hypothetical protein Poli38472_006896 [Pythium oligandrum]|eukprot:TMW58751.1 hypothetical protein Poli38472_006896 [Pythium oligandrum]
MFHAAWKSQAVLAQADPRRRPILPSPERDHGNGAGPVDDMDTSITRLAELVDRSPVREMTARFARMLTLREASLRDPHGQPSKRRRGQVKSCAREKKQARQRIQTLRLQQNRELEASIAALQQQLVELERTRTLQDSQLLMWRTNRTGVVADLCKEYFQQFSQGYDTTKPQKASVYEAAKNFIYSITEGDELVCREYKGVENLLNQWEIYTKYHGDIAVRLCSITLIEEEDKLVSICCAGEMRLTITEATLAHLYPHFYAQTQEDSRTHRLKQSLIGKSYVLSFDKVLHFNDCGKVFAHESKVHLASGILNALQDPFAAMKMIEASLMTEDGHWKMPHENEVQDEMNEMPKLIL